MITRTMLAKLAAPFPDEAIGTKPEIWCPPCKARDVVCDEHEVKPCATCGTTVTEAHDDVRYVGHAYVRARLNEVDPGWNWKPAARDAHGLPLLDEHGGLWMYLTIGGKTMLGYGDAPAQRGSRAVKETIGDGLRNAGMSFGIALEFWQQWRPPRVLQPAKPHLTPEQRANRLREEITKHYHRKHKKYADVVGEFGQWAGDRGAFRTAGPELLAEFKAHAGVK